MLIKTCVHTNNITDVKILCVTDKGSNVNMRKLMSCYKHYASMQYASVHLQVGRTRSAPGMLIPPGNVGMHLELHHRCFTKTHLLFLLCVCCLSETIV